MKTLKQLMTDVAKGKITMEKAKELYGKPKKVSVRGSNKQNTPIPTHTRKKSIKSREVKQ